MRVQGVEIDDTRSHQFSSQGVQTRGGLRNRLGFVLSSLSPHRLVALVIRRFSSVAPVLGISRGGLALLLLALLALLALLTLLAVAVIRFGSVRGGVCRRLARLGVVLKLETEHLRVRTLTKQTQQLHEPVLRRRVFVRVQHEVQRSVRVEVEVPNERLHRSDGGGGVAVARSPKLRQRGDQLGVSFALFSQQVELVLGVDEPGVDANLLLFPPDGGRDEAALLQELSLAPLDEELARQQRLAAAPVAVAERLGELHEF